MKNTHKLMFLLVVVLAAGCAGSSPYMEKVEPTVTKPSPDKALVYFMRPSSFAYANDFQIWDRYKLIGISVAKGYFAYECDPGEHLFIGTAENNRAVAADLEAGKAYYVLIDVKMGWWRPRMAFIPVTRGSGYWDQVEIYKKELNFLSTKPEVVAVWEARKEKKEKAEAELKEIINYLATPEGARYISNINKEDGR